MGITPMNGGGSWAGTIPWILACEPRPLSEPANPAGGGPALRRERSIAIKLARRQTLLGSPAPARQSRPRGHGNLAPYESFLVQTVEARPHITLAVPAALLMEEHGVVAAPATLLRLLCRYGFTYKNIPDSGGVRTLRCA